MTQEDKELLLKDLCARLPYGVTLVSKWGNYHSLIVETSGLLKYLEKDGLLPYLRPMSSMTEEELEDLNTLAYHNIGVQDNALCGYICGNEIEDICDWLNAHHFDYRGIYDEKDRKWKTMIEMGLALPAPKEMYNLKK